MIPSALIAASIKPFLLSLLNEGESYGYEIIQRVHELTGGEVRYTTSTLYPVLHRLENQGLLESFWRASEEGPRRKYYRITQKGQKALGTEKRN